MYVFLLLLSAITTATGLFAIGFGLAPYEGSLGNALVMAGSVGVVGGMILFGLAAAVRQLRHIADAMGPRPAPVRRPAVADSAEPGAPRQAAAARVPYPARPAEGREARSDARGGEARPSAAPPAQAPEVRVERPRAAAARSSEPPIVEEQDTVPLAPQRGPPVPVSRGAPPRAEADGRPTPADIMARLSNLAAAPPRSLARPELQRASPPALERPAAEARPRQNPNVFDALWPAEQRAPRQSQPEAIARAPRPEPRTDMRAEPKLEVRPEPKHEPRLEPPKVRDRIDPAPPAAGARPIAILKSGVIDGMAYTLYTDGSIEAELPQGTMRFGSIDELRTHLENAERQA
jgi:hypothetical protein